VNSFKSKRITVQCSEGTPHDQTAIEYWSDYSAQNSILNNDESDLKSPYQVYTADNPENFQSRVPFRHVRIDYTAASLCSTVYESNDRNKTIGPLLASALLQNAVSYLDCKPIRKNLKRFPDKRGRPPTCVSRRPRALEFRKNGRGRGQDATGSISTSQGRKKTFLRRTLYWTEFDFDGFSSVLRRTSLFATCLAYFSSHKALPGRRK